MPTFKYYDYEPYLPSSPASKADVLTLIVSFVGWIGAKYAESKALDELAPEIAKRMRSGGGVLVRLAYQRAEGGLMDFEGPRVFRFASIVGVGPTARMVLDYANQLNAQCGTLEPALWESWQAEDEYLWVST